MAYSKHIIKKQVIELEIDEELNSAEIQNRVSRIYHDAVVPLLDKLFSDKSALSLLVIDHLEIDVGEIPEDKLEEILAEKIKTVLQKNLASIKPSSAINTGVEAKHNNRQAQSDHSAEALIIHFLRTGLFPWWAQENNYNFLEQSFYTVIKQNNTAFKNSFIGLLQDDEIIKRVAYNFKDALHEAIAKQFFNTGSDIIQPEKEELFSVFTDSYNLQDLRYYWRMSLYKIMIASVIHSEKNLFEKTIELFIALVLQRSDVTRTLISFSPGNNPIIFSEKINHLKNKFLIQTLKDHLENKILNDEYAHKQIRAGNIFPNKINDGSSAEKQQAIPPAGLDKMNLQSQELTNKIPAKRKHAVPGADLDKIYIQNAGLILLHPFLPRFFQHLELADDRNFINEAAAERACHILQYLAAGNTEDIFEAQLPLNKILCGLSLLQPVHVQFEITESEKEIAEHFLLSVIQNGGAGWKNLSIEGLQQAYLNREGILSARDDNWLLQVKRETYDILVDRLPWTIQIVKLPWMERLVFAEW